MKPFFSIIIPTLNEEKFVGKLLTDLTKQTHKDFEIILVDAESEDTTIQVVQKFKSFLPLNKIMQISGRNVSRQRNLGAKNAQGAFLVFLDADSRIVASFLSKLFIYIKVHKGLLFLPGFCVSKQDPQLSMLVEFTNALVGLSNKIGKPFSTGGSMIVEKNFFSLIEGFPEDESLSEDHRLVRNAYKHGVNAKLLSSIKVQCSLRRFQREGKLELLYKYIKGTLYFLAKGKVDKKIIKYEMGGHLYNKQSRRVFYSFLRIKPHLLIKKFNKTIYSLIRKFDE